MLYYGKCVKSGVHNVQTTDYTPEYIATHYKHSDGRGRYATFPCTNEGGGNKPYEFRGITRAWRFEREKMDAMFRDGLLTQAKPTSPFRSKKYLNDAEGVKVSDLWTDVTSFEKDERTGSPDQKPLRAYERVILAGSNEGDLVLDPFAGCATTIIAARNHSRRWVGVDRRTDARFHVVCRLAGIKKSDADQIRRQPGLPDWLDDQLAKYEAHYATLHQNAQTIGKLPLLIWNPSTQATTGRSSLTMKCTRYSLTGLARSVGVATLMVRFTQDVVHGIWSWTM